MKRTEEYRILQKLATNVSKMSKFHEKILKIFYYGDLTLSPEAQHIYNQVSDNESVVSSYVFNCHKLAHELQKQFKMCKPARFAPEQLKEMRYLRSEGVAVAVLARKYKADKGTIKKYLNQPTEETAE